MKEIWKDISGFEGRYMISTAGRVRSLDRYVRNQSSSSSQRLVRGRILKPANNGSGYLFVALCKHSKYTPRTIHTLVAEAFIPNPENKPTVNHIDGDKSNNSVENLEWATYSEQNIHAIQKGLRKGWTEEARRRVSQASKEREGKAVRCITTGEVFHSMRDAEKAYGLGSSTVSTSIYECRETSGYRFEFVDNSSAIRQPKVKIDKRKVRRKVICKTSGKVYNSLSAAARDTGMDSTSVKNSIDNKRPAKGLLFEYLEVI